MELVTRPAFHNRYADLEQPIPVVRRMEVNPSDIWRDSMPNGGRVTSSILEGILYNVTRPYEQCRKR
jgi:hypothetical protein